jgi:hypothetical protein
MCWRIQLIAAQTMAGKGHLQRSGTCPGASALPQQADGLTAGSIVCSVPQPDLHCRRGGGGQSVTGYSSTFLSSAFASFTRMRFVAAPLLPSGGAPLKSRVSTGEAATASLSHRRYHVDRRIVELCFDVDDLGIARTKAAQFVAHWSGIALPVEDLPPVVIGRPPTAATVVPAGEPCVGSGSKRNAVWHLALPFSPLERVPSHSCKLRTLAHFKHWPILIVATEPIGSEKRHMCVELGLSRALPAPVRSHGGAKPSRLHVELLK